MNIYYLQSAAAVLLTFGLVIFIHELGHFLMCLRLGVRVEKFAFGMGPELFGVTRGETRYSLCAVPLGGFVKPAGEEIEGCSGKTDEYYGQTWYRRLAIVYSGPLMNYLLAFVLFAGVVYLKGMPEFGDKPVIGNMVTGFPADRAGVRIGDEILAFNGRPITAWRQLSDAIHAAPKQEISLRLRREGREFLVKLATRVDDSTGYGVVGIMPESVFKPVGALTALWEGAAQCYNFTAVTAKTIASKIWRRERPDLAGPVGIAQMVSRAAHSGWEDLVFLIGFISVAIGFFNLLPVPLLDGGHAVIYFWEGLSRRRLTQELMTKANSVGFVLLALLIIFATYSDVVRLREDRAARKAQAAQAAP
ncbi:MAG: site-2 protease family protein [Elusimicrobia bacterium]|nr:site-2 protease family protein [Elusimicrobiota bacterium]